jgi:hypothetical protein
VSVLIASRSFVVRCAATIGIGVWSVGCSSAGDGAGAPNAGAALAADAEGARVQAYLDSLYTAKDVRHSFRSAMGDTIDCADFASAPGVRKLLARGKSMDDIMAPIRQAHEKRPATGSAARRNPAYLQGDHDDEGNVRSCPDGTYPRVRITRETIAARGGLDAYLQSSKAAPPRMAVDHPLSAVPLDGGLQLDTGHYAWVENEFSPNATLSSAQGGTSTMTIAEPTLSGFAGDHSVAQVWLTGATRATGLPRQTIEAGWEAVSPGVAGPVLPQLFIGTTPNGYATWCLDDNTSSACPAWVPNPTASLTLGGTLPASTPGGTQHELTITIEHAFSYIITCIIRHGCTNTKVYSGWSIFASVDGGGADTYLGYYANDGYDNDGSSGLSVGGDNFIMGGEVYDTGENFGPPPEVTMGEGPLPMGKATIGSTAVHHDFGYYDSTDTLQAGGSVVHNTNPVYVFDISTPPGNPAWANYFYYGDYAP